MIKGIRFLIATSNFLTPLKYKIVYIVIKKILSFWFLHNFIQKNLSHRQTNVFGGPPEDQLWDKESTKFLKINQRIQKIPNQNFFSKYETG